MGQEQISEGANFKAQTAEQRQQELEALIGVRPEQGERIEHMDLYHGSKLRVESLESRQAASKEGVVVPVGELLDGIYFTPDKITALAMAARPAGLTTMEGDGDERTIQFEHPELFDPEQEVFLYKIDSYDIPRDNLVKVDEGQYVVTGMKGLRPDSVEVRKAGDILEYYRQV